MAMKVCTCKAENAHYNDFGIYKCQYCMGIITDLDRVKKIIEYNTPVNEQNRDKVIEKELNHHKVFIAMH